MRAHPEALDEVLHSGPRIRIMTRLVLHRSMRFGALQTSVGLTAGNLASHLTTLEKSGYVAQERNLQVVSPTKTVRITGTGENAFRDYIQQLKALIRSVEGRGAAEASHMH